MKITQNEAEEALETINLTIQKTRRAIAQNGTYIFLIITGVVWMVGFMANQFLQGDILQYIWIGLSLIGSALSVLFGSQMVQQVRGELTKIYGRRVGLFWFLLVLFGIAVIIVAQPANGKQITLMIVLLVMLGQMAMSLLFSFSSTWWSVPIAVLSLMGYYLFPEYFYLWMSILVGGGMVALGVYIRTRW
jgi:hypothetical protein